MEHNVWKLVHSERSLGAEADIYDNADSKSEVVDGISQVALGPNVVRLSFYTADGNEPDKNDDQLIVEQRYIRVKLVMPTPTLLELVEKLNDLISHRKEHLIGKNEEFVSALRNF